VEERAPAQEEEPPPAAPAPVPASAPAVGSLAAATASSAAWSGTAASTAGSRPPPATSHQPGSCTSRACHCRGWDAVRNTGCTACRAFRGEHCLNNVNKQKGRSAHYAATGRWEDPEFSICMFCIEGGGQAGPVNRCQLCKERAGIAAPPGPPAGSPPASPPPGLEAWAAALSASPSLSSPSMTSATPLALLGPSMRSPDFDEILHQIETMKDMIRNLGEQIAEW
jgi:hypothetical protein